MVDEAKSLTINFDAVLYYDRKTIKEKVYCNQYVQKIWI